MKVMKLLYKIMLVIVAIIICSSSICYATDNEGIISNTGLPDLNNDSYKPTAQIGDSTVTMVSTILSVLTGLGIVAVIIGIALIGFNTILGSASEKAVNQEKYVGILIAALLITGGSVIAKFFINFAENLL